MRQSPHRLVVAEVVRTITGLKGNSNYSSINVQFGIRHMEWQLSAKQYTRLYGPPDAHTEIW